jgi:hypothetical protein
LAGSAFTNEDVIAAVTDRFTPILIDADVDKKTPAKFGASGWPTVVFTDRKGGAIKKSVGAVPVAKFLSAAEDAGKDAGKPRPSKDYKVLTAAKEDLDEALAKEKPAKALSAIAKIEKVGREGRILDAAVEAKAKLAVDGKAAVTAAVAAADAQPEKSLKTLKKVLRDYKGLDAVVDVAKVAIATVEEKIPAK